jgi:F420-non-reducing hydrogenase large subunit
MDEIMHHVAGAQEAATILGGRLDHPLTAVAGGVSRFLKEGYYERLREIADSCVEFAGRLAKFLRERLFQDASIVDLFHSVSFSPMMALSQGPEDGDVLLKDESGKEIERFSPQETFSMVELHQEKWTYEAFAFLKQKGWPGLEGHEVGGLFFVGPLARLGAQELETPLAEEERQKLMSSLGPFPHFNVAAAYWSLVIELIQTSEKMQDLYVQEKLVGPFIRTIPAEMGTEGCAALESPEGFILHRYEVDERGILQRIQVLDAAMENNALRCLLAQKAVENSVARKQERNEIKKMIELSLLPF